MSSTLDTVYKLPSEDLNLNVPITYTGGYTPSQTIPAYRYHTTYDPQTSQQVQSGQQICVGNCGSSQNCTFRTYDKSSCIGTPINQLFDGTNTGSINDIEQCKTKCRNDPDCNAFNIVKGSGHNNNYCYWKNIDIDNLDENIEENTNQDCHVCFNN
jgi:hypothetical protein